MRRSSFYSLIGILALMGCTVPLLMNTDKQQTKKDISTFSFVYSPSPYSTPFINYTLPQPIATPSGFGVVGSVLPGTYFSPTPFIGISTPTPSTFISSIPFQTNPSKAPFIVYSGPPSIIQGNILGFNYKLNNYTNLSNVEIVINNKSLMSSSSGFYSSGETFNDTVTISATKEGYIASTVQNVPPGLNRDIHLYPLNDSVYFEDKIFTFSGKVNNQQNTGKYVMVVFNDGEQTAINQVDEHGNYRISIRPKVNKNNLSGSLMTYTMETVNDLTQITAYGFNPYITIPTPNPTPTPIGSGSPSTSGSSTPAPMPSNILTLSYDYNTNNEAFGYLKLNLSCPSTLSFPLVNVYMTLPTGAKFFVAKYVDRMGTGKIQKTIRVPKITGATFSIQAHAGNSEVGSDIIIPKASIGETIEYTFLSPPNINSPLHNSIISTTPSFSWQGVSEATSYQLELKPLDKNINFAWEAYTPYTSIQYPSFTSESGKIKSGQKYNLQLMATDYAFNSLHVLNEDTLKVNNKNIPIRIKKCLDKNKDLAKFYIMLADPTKNMPPSVYRISYRNITIISN